MRSSLLVSTSMVICVLAATGCSDDSSDSSPAPAPSLAARIGDENVPIGAVERGDPGSEYERRIVLKRLIQRKWINKEVEARGISASRADVVRQLRDEFKINSGDQAPQILAVARFSAQRDEVARRLLGNPFRITEPELRRYFEAHRDRYILDETRRINLVLASSKERAQRAKMAIARGASWPEVVAKYSADEERRRSGFTQEGYVKNADPVGYHKAVFDAQKGVLMGPILTEGKWAVFEVIIISPERQRPYADARHDVLAGLREDRRHRVMQQLYEALRDKYRAATVCTGQILIPECKNGPDKAGRYVN